MYILIRDVGVGRQGGGGVFSDLAASLLHFDNIKML